jgi:ABC-2 type transport system ATP-binding protein
MTPALAAAGGATAGRVLRPPVVELRDVCRRYGDVTAVDGVTADIVPGSVVAVLGSNGAGKTTLVQMLAGFVAPTSGTVRVLGEDPRRASRRWRAQVGMVAQATALDPQLTLQEVLAALAGPYPAPMPSGEALDLVGLTGQAHTRLQALSGGQQRRADLAAAIIGRPSLLFLDEPTTGFDPAARRQTWAMLEQLAGRGTTILLTTHYLDEANRLAGRVLVLAAGRVIADATPAALRARAGGSAVRYPLPRLAGVPPLPEQLRRHLDPHANTICATGDSAVPVLAAIVAWARANQLDLSALEVGPPTLEDAYLALTRAGQAREHRMEAARA